ncbi:MAG TPA: FHA domain-containing protein [Vicinamibacterales bacterium]|nr:FHA domain-containing protein [Vicinamibacterales bacterium]
MAQADVPSRPAPARRSARDIVEAVVDNMRQNLEPLKYSTLAPTRYLVYLHPAEFRRLESILPRIRQETIRALTSEVDAINRRRDRLHRVRTLLRHHDARVEGAATDWAIEFLPDPDGDLSDGDILVDSELVLPSPPELGAGASTRRITTGRIGHQTTRQEATVRSTPLSPAAVYATLGYTDDEGAHAFEMTKDSIAIGRGGIAYRVDVRVKSAVDVSREHARIRRDPATGHFFLIDLSTLGTTVNGARVPRGYDDDDGNKRENGVEAPLPDGARIGLADMVYLDFHPQGQK